MTFYSYSAPFSTHSVQMGIVEVSLDKQTEDEIVKIIKESRNAKLEQYRRVCKNMTTAKATDK